MESIKRHAESDLDYDLISENSLKRICVLEGNDLKTNCERITMVIKKEMKNELSKKQEEVHVIQKRLLKAQKTLHLLKYIVIKSFYDRKDLKISNVEESVVKFSSDILQVKNIPPPGQNRIHPAIKKLIGKKPIAYEPYRTRTQSQNVTNMIKEEQPTEISEKIKSDNLKRQNPQSTSVVSNSNDIDAIHINPIRNRQKNKYQIVVGNISKWISVSNSRDSSTHKWMVYVRGPRDSPDISHIVKKIRFFLHPSYQPNDIVEMEEQPFHLSRRGWGEFPLRVQIHFQCSANKPVDVIHNLKLDRTYTGRQTLGNETLIDVWLYDNTKDEFSILNSPDNCKSMKRELGDELFDSSSNGYKTQIQFVANNELKREETNTRNCQQTLNEQKIIADNNVKSFHHNENALNIAVDKNQEDCVQNLNFQFQADTNKNLQNIVLYDQVQYKCSDTKYSRISKIPLDNASYASTSNEIDNSKIKSACRVLNKRNIDEKGNNMDWDRNTKEEVDCDDIGGINKTLTSERTIQVENNSIFNINTLSKNMKLSKNKSFSSSSTQLKSKSSKSLLKCNNIIENSALAYLIDHCYTNKINTIHFENHVHNNKRDVEQEICVIDAEKYKIDVRVDQFSSTRQIIYFLLKSLPLVTELANDPSYKTCYPYAATTLKEFSSWNPTKRCCSEWFRAKHIKNILVHQKIADEENWTVKIILMFGRAHAFTPLAKYDLFKIRESGKTIPNRVLDTEIISTLTEHTSISNLMSRLDLRQHVDDDNCIIDVDGIDDKIEENTVKCSENDPDMEIEEEFILPCTYIKECAREIEIYLNPEEILPGVSYNLSERLLLQAIKCFAEELIRRAFSNKIVRNRGRNLDFTIEKNEVLKVLLERPEFDIFLNEGLGRSVESQTSIL